LGGKTEVSGALEVNVGAQKQHQNAIPINIGNQDIMGRPNSLEIKVKKPSY